MSRASRVAAVVLLTLLSATPAVALTSSVRPAEDGRAWPPRVHACAGAVVGWISQQPAWTTADFEIRDIGREQDFVKMVVGYVHATIDGAAQAYAFGCVYPGAAATPAGWNIW